MYKKYWAYQKLKNFKTESVSVFSYIVKIEQLNMKSTNLNINSDW